MKKRITLILILMSACVTGITGLQLYWNYQNYHTVVKTFKHDVNEALTNAVDQELDLREQKIADLFKSWLADTSQTIITCNNKNIDSATVFRVQDAHPFPEASRGAQFGISDFKQKLSHITPEAKTILINFMADSMVKRDLRRGIVYFYTQKLGRKLEKEVEDSRHDPAALNRIYAQQLKQMDINAAFVLNPSKTVGGKPFLTRTINAGIQRPHQKDMVFAEFENPGTYFMREMKWLLLSSFLLIGITICCFAYTVKTILTQQKLAALKNDFVSNMAHELKTPVATINIAAEAIQEFNLSKVSADEYLGIIRYQAANLTSLIDQILKNIISEQKNTGINPSSVDVTDLLEKLVQEYAPQSAAAKTPVRFVQDKGRVTTLADPALLKNAVSNLLDNAIKYGGTGATVTVSLNTEEGNVIIAVADNGPGIPLKYQDRIFERFFRVPAGDLHNVKGYGLGLNYARAVIEQHGGTLTFISKEGSGTTFRISIPLVYNETGQNTFIGG
ncbi:MAG TPA: HAMP domain-containing sensor histidine kinase [Mucilaginibacter sp.]|nr:HAMP domain-containing sensor histidine kinase [Mucilaginibacter sp.]